jgi:hypothetical protein
MEKASKDPINKVSLNKMLGGFEKNFKKDIDQLWLARDPNNEGLLDKEKCRIFLKQGSRTIRN